MAVAAPSAPEPADYLRAYAGVQRAADADIMRVLREAYRDTNQDLQRLATQQNAGSLVRREQLQAVKRNLLLQQAEIFKRTGKIIEQRRVEAAARAIQVAGRYDAAVFALGGRDDDARALADGLEETELRTLDAVVARMGHSRMPLSERVYRTGVVSSGILERRINSALARGLSAQEMAAEIRDYVNPNTPGGVRYAALRLARTEINNAFHAMSVQAAIEKPWIKGMEWQLSRSHPAKPVHRCDELNGQVFRPEDVPRKPHPQCLCIVVPTVGDTPEDDEAFLDALVSGEYDSYLDRVADEAGLPANPPRPPPAPAKVAKVAKAVKKAAPAKAAKKTAPAAPAKAQPRFQVPTMASVPRSADAERLTSNTRMRQELDLQAAITPNCAGQLFSLELRQDMPAGVGGLYNRPLRRIRINNVISDGLTGRTIQSRAERTGYHPTCGAEHSTAQAHLAHEYGHHVHYMLDFMPLEDREVLRDLVADMIGVARPARANRNSVTFNPNYTTDLRSWMETHRKEIERFFGAYAGTNEREMLAEIWSSYSTNPNTTEIIRRIGERMRELGEAGAVRGEVSRPDQDAERTAAIAEKIRKAMEGGPQ